jgi:7-carboxy-7-deazaguanine synthase
MGIDMIVEEVEKHPCHHVVLTGGEPMIAKEMRDLAKRLKARGRHITIETAGTVPPEGISCDLASISPKLANSTPPESKAHAWTAKHDALRLQPAVIQNWLEKYHTQLKFVVQGESDLVEIDDLLKKLTHVKPEQVLLMPEGIDAKVLKEKGLVVANICKSRGFRYCPRLHVELYGNKRGT